MRKEVKGYSMVELLLTISLLLIIGVIATTGYVKSEDKSKNTKILGDIETLRNGIESYKEEVKELPKVKGNLKYYKEDTSYNHSEEGSFGVSGYITEESLPQKYINSIPIDIRTNQYYGYGKTTQTNNYEIAGVLKKEDGWESIVRGNWKGESGPYNLIKEYAGPNYVSDESKTSFAYNPEEKILIGKINSYSGVIKINDIQYTNEEILSYTIKEGDKITINTGGIVDIYYCDGTTSVLGDTTSTSEISMTNMKYIEGNNLYTSIKMSLNIGSIWNKATKLSDKSEFEIYTTDTVAAVRGTIYGLKKELNTNSGTNVMVKEGKVELKQMLGLSAQSFQSYQTGGVLQIENGKSYIEVKSGSGMKGISYKNYLTGTPGGNTVISNTGGLNTLPAKGKLKIIDNVEEINEGQKPELSELNVTSTGYTIKLKLNESYKRATHLKLLTKSGSGYNLNNPSLTLFTGSVLTLTGYEISTVTKFYSGSYKNNALSNLLLSRLLNTGSLLDEGEFKFCSSINDKERCSKGLKIRITSSSKSYDESKKITESCDEGEIDEMFRENFGKVADEKMCKMIMDKKEEFIKLSRQEKLEKILNNSQELCINYRLKHKNDREDYGVCKSRYINIGGERVENTLFNTGYTLVGYAGYNKPKFSNLDTGTSGNNTINNYNLYTKTGVIQIDSGALYALSHHGTAQCGAVQDCKKKILGISNNHNFYKIGDVDGILIDTIGNGEDNATDYLKYDLGTLGLNTGSGFAIEMGVRGGALSSSSGGKTLFGIGKYFLYKENLNSMTLGNLNFKDSNIGFLSTIYKNNLQQTLDENNFYKVVFTSVDGKIKIYDYSGKELLVSERMNTLSFSNMELFVGSNSTKGEQWNDFIDYVKIYKK